jgi:HlyD family secretion protein
VLIKIAQDLSRMEIATAFAEADIGTIHVGQEAHFSVDAYPARPFVGGVKQIRLSPTTLQNVVSYNAVISVDNPDLSLLPGMTAYVSIHVAERKDALLVPNAALRFKPADLPPAPRPPKDRHKAEGLTGTVYVLEGRALRPVRLELGISDNRDTEIRAGALKAGDLVVTGDLHREGDAGAQSGVRLRPF